MTQQRNKLRHWKFDWSFSECSKVLGKSFFEYRGRPWTVTLFKLINNLFLLPFSLAIYLLFRHYEPLKFQVCKSARCSLSKKLFVSSELDESLVLLLRTFCQKLPDFDQDHFRHFRALLKQKGQPGEKWWTAESLSFLRKLIST